MRVKKGNPKATRAMAENVHVSNLLQQVPVGGQDNIKARLGVRVVRLRTLLNHHPLHVANEELGQGVLEVFEGMFVEN